MQIDFMKIRYTIKVQETTLNFNNESSNMYNELRWEYSYCVSENVYSRIQPMYILGWVM